MRSAWLPLTLLLAALLTLFFAPSQASAQQPGAVLIWPVNPVIEADRQAAALWLENPGKTPVTLQIRIYAWAQDDGQNLYAEQQAVIGTPPIVMIAPGTKQLVRLTRLGPVPTDHERPYRLIIDEIPVEGAAAATPGAAISFRMRYSLPLFVLGSAALAKDRHGDKPSPMAPTLDWRIIAKDGGRFVEIRNAGVVHARLTDAALGGIPLAAGLLGYVLPGQTMRWPLPPGADANADVNASVNGAPSASISRQQD